MRPDPDKRLSRRAFDARVRMRLAADVDWLEGYPLEVVDDGVVWWGCAPDQRGERILVDRARLHRTTRTWSLLTHRSPDALDRVLGAHAAHRRRTIEATLDALGATIHKGAPLVPPSPSTEEGALQSEVVWRYGQDPDVRKAASEALRRLDGPVSVLVAQAPEQGRAVALDLVGWVDRKDRRVVEPLLRLLGNPLLWTVAPTGGAWPRAVRKQAQVRFEETGVWLPERPVPAFGRRLLQAVDEVRVFRSAHRRDALRILSALDPRDDLAPWGIWWKQVDRWLQGVLRATGRPGAMGELRARLGEVDALTKSSPTVEAPWRARQDAAVRLARDARSAAASADALERCPVSHRGTLIEVLGREAGDEGGARSRGAASLAAFLAGVAGQEWFPAMLEGLERYHQAVFVRQRSWSRGVLTILGPRVARARWTAALDLVDEAADEHLSVERAAFVAALPDAGPFWARTRAMKVAETLCPRNDAGFEAVYQALAGLKREGELPLDFVRTDRGRALVRDLILDRRWGALWGVVAEGTVARGLGDVPPAPAPRSPPSPTPVWTDRYGPLRAEVLRLAAEVPDAEAKARRLLGSWFPDDGALEAQIGALESRGDGAGFEARIAALRDRLANPVLPAAARIEKLSASLRRAVLEARVERWIEALRAAADRALRDLSGGHLLAVTPEQKRSFALLAGIGRTHQSVVRRLAAVRSEPPPWDLRDDPVHARWRRAMEQRGVILGPWLDPAPPETRSTPIGEVSLGFEPDPLEVLRMGEPFRTCLSPGSMNYFSALTNAVDLNKRVLYARHEGRIVGRCLVVLTREGGLLPFHVYCHHVEIGLRTWIADVLRRLADSMRTRVVARGVVPLLIGRGWYDDGPVELPGAAPIVPEDHPLRTSVAGRSAGEVVALAAAAVAPLGLDELTLPVVLALPVFDEHPQVAVELAARAVGRRLPAEAWLRAATLAADGGRPELAGRLLRQGLRRPTMGVSTIAEVLELCLRVDPGLALRAVRRFLSAGQKLEDAPPIQLWFVGRAYERLHRRARARAVYEVGAARRGWGAEECRKALATLDAR